MQATIIDTAGLVRLNNEAIRTDRNRALVENIGDLLDPDGVHVLWFEMIHNDVEMRTGWLLKMRDQDEPEQVFLDMSFEDFENLQRIEVEDGSESEDA